MRRPCRSSEANTLSLWLCCRSKVTIGGSKQVWFEMSLECWSRLLLLDLRSVGNWFPWRGAALQKALSPIFHRISTFITADTLSRIMRLTLSCSEGILVMLGTLTSTTSISLCKSSKQKLVRTQFVFFRLSADRHFSVIVKQVMRVTMSSAWKAVKVEEIYSNNGTDISSLSVAVANMNEDAMLIGTIASNAYYCKLKSAWNILQTVFSYTWENLFCFCQVMDRYKKVKIT